MNDSRLYNILLSPFDSEKTVRLGDAANQYAFKVASDASKLEIKQAVEKLFNVVVKAVNTTNMKAKVKRFKHRLGARKAWKKAYITLQTGHEIDLSKLDKQ